MTALENYLAYYETRSKPGYAVLVTGAWGVGKTFQVRKALQSKQPFYVSLFGLQTTAEIYETIFAEMFPEAAQLKEIADGAKETSIAGIPVGAFASQFVGLFTRERAEASRTLILDDLERSRIDPSDLLGIINRYVEHHGCRVVVIAHEGKLADLLLEQREKIFGQTVLAVADVEGAYDAFATELKDPYGALQKHRAELMHLFRQSGVQSLRILRHVMEDAARLVGCLTDDQRAHADATSSLVKFVAALNLDVRYNRLLRADIRDRRTKIDVSASSARDKEKTVHAVYETSERYPEVRFENNLLSDEVLEAVLFEGVFSPEAISQELARTSYFTPQKELPDWIVVYNFQGYTDQVVLDALDRIEKGFAQRSYTIPGEMLHIFALRLLMSGKGVLSLSQLEVVAECKTYIDDLHSQGLLRSSSMQPSMFTDDVRNGYQQYGYWVQDEDAAHFNELRSYLAIAREQVLAETLPAEAGTILQAVETSGTKFFELINYTAAGEPKYGEVPVLANIPADKFVAAWLSSPVPNWYWIKSALDERMKRSSPATDAEKVWLGKVIDLLEKAAENGSRLGAFRIARSMPNRPSHGDDDGGGFGA
jgi:hypothetical protein